MTDPARELWLRLQKVQTTLEDLEELPNRFAGDKNPFAWTTSVEDLLRKTDEALEAFEETAESLRKTLGVLGKIPAGPFTPAVKLLTKLLTTAIRSLKNATSALAELNESAWKLFTPVQSSVENLTKVADRVSSDSEPVRSRVETLARLLRDLEGIEHPRVPALLQRSRVVVTALEAPSHQYKILQKEWKEALLEITTLKSHVTQVTHELTTLKWIRSKLGTVRSAAAKVAAKIKWILSFLPWWASLTLETVLEWINGVIEWLLEVTGIQALLEWLTNLEALVEPFRRKLDELQKDLKGLGSRLTRLTTPLETMEKNVKHLHVPMDPLIRDLKQAIHGEGVPINRAQLTPEEAHRFCANLRALGIRVELTDETASFEVKNDRPILRLSRNRSKQVWQEEYLHYLQWKALRRSYEKRGRVLTEAEWKRIASDPRTRFKYERQVKLWLLRNRRRLGFTTQDHTRLVEDLARYFHKLLPDLWDAAQPGSSRQKRRKK